MKIMLKLIITTSFLIPVTTYANSADDIYAADKKYYEVDSNGRVGKKTYNGWRRFGSCAGCHGSAATGGTSGPNLLESFKTKKIDFVTFRKIVADGRLEKGMPSWKQDPNVSKYFIDIYGYLRARSDGVLKSGRPKKIPK